MISSRPLFAVWGCLLLSALTFASSPALATPLHLTDAETLLADLSISKQNVYGSNPSYIKWNGASSQARTVCGSFINNLLVHSYSLTANTFTRWMGTTSPYAETYYAAILAKNNFARIDNLQQVQPGDIIAIKYSGSSVTGHTMMVDALARVQGAQAPIVAGTTQYAVTVIDSSSTPHGATDTRVTAPSTTHNGIGKGDIRIYVDAALQPVGYTWSNERGSQYYSMAQRPLAIGRIDFMHLGVNTSSQVGSAVGTITGEIVIQEDDAMSGKTDDDSLAAAPTIVAGLADADQLGGCSLTAHARPTSPAAFLALLGFMGLLALRWNRRSRANTKS